MMFMLGDMTATQTSLSRDNLSSETTQLDEAVTVFKALADPARLRILQHLSAQNNAGCCFTGVCACDFEAITGLSQPTVSHHMKTLMNAGLINGTKQGKWMYYQINPQGFNAISHVLPALTSC